MRVRNWELQVQFKVSGSTKDLYGDGFAIWYVRDRMQGGPVFGSRDYFSGLAIVADTYSNHNGPHNVSNWLLIEDYLFDSWFHLQHNHPYLSAMINNGSVHYDHDRDGTHTMIGGCEVKFRNFAHDTYLNIRYENDVLTGKKKRKSSIFQRNCFIGLFSSDTWFGQQKSLGAMFPSRRSQITYRILFRCFRGYRYENQVNFDPENMP